MNRSLLLGVLILGLPFVNGDADKWSTGNDGVLQLNSGNFDRALREHEQLLVHFYVPLSGQGHQVSAAFEGAAVELQGSEVKLAVVDAAKEKDLAKELNVAGSSEIRLYVSGDKHSPVVCPVPQSSTSILTWLRRRAGSPGDLVRDLSQLETSEDVTVVGFFRELNQEYVQTFYATAIQLPDVSFAITQDNEVTHKYGLTYDVVFLLRKSKLIQAYKLMPQTSKEELMVFISVYQMDPVTEYTGKTANQILSSPVLNHALLFIRKSSADFNHVYSAFNNAAQSFRVKILFVWVNVDEPRNGRLMEYFRVRDFEAPLIRVVNLTSHVTYQLPSDTLEVESIKTFCASYLEGKAKPKMQSEAIPEGWDTQPVKELVGMNLEEVAFNPNKTVFVMFYLPYSPASRALFPLWEELAEATEGREGVVIARIDASANDINLSPQGAYPTLCLFPALHAERMVVYSGERRLEDLIQFLNTEMEKAKRDRVQEDEDRRKYIKDIKDEEAKKADKSKDEL
ncbi:protein disulfide-isomerase isoform X1 [Takifugu rubripes]|uniref:Zgc:136472 n=2 Tax=Takifugu rubripes TaxID=31033 RepID=H2T9Y7_TAKRU|nr:protein disulfide-isomerase-like isoform X1 [Takifugu rubripes]